MSRSILFNKKIGFRMVFISVVFILAALLQICSTSSAGYGVPLIWGMQYKETSSASGSYTFTTSQQGLLTLEGFSIYGTDMEYRGYLKPTIYNASGEIVSSVMVNASGANEKGYVALPQGSYTLKVNDDHYRFKASFMTYREKSGKSKASAITLKKGKTAKGVVLHSERRKKDWYKIVLKKPARITLLMNGMSENGIMVNIRSGSVRFGIDYSQILTTGKLKIPTKVLTGYKKLPAGTYYISICDAGLGGNNGGAYTVQWR